MLSWLNNLFRSKCPNCKSTHISEVPWFTLTYSTYYKCHDCGYRWRESGL